MHGCCQFCVYLGIAGSEILHVGRMTPPSNRPSQIATPTWSHSCAALELLNERFGWAWPRELVLTVSSVLKRYILGSYCTLDVLGPIDVLRDYDSLTRTKCRGKRSFLCLACTQELRFLDGLESFAVPWNCIMFLPLKHQKGSHPYFQSCKGFPNPSFSLVTCVDLKS